MMRLKQLLTLIILAGWQIWEWVIYQGDNHVLLIMAAIALTAFVFILLPSPSREENALEYESSFLWFGPVAAAMTFSAVALAFAPTDAVCGWSQECTWSSYARRFILVAIARIPTFWTCLLTASFIALLFKTAFAFCAGIASGRAAFYSLLRSKRLRLALTVSTMIAWYALVISYELSWAARMLLAVAVAFLLGKLLLVLPTRSAQAHRSISELGSTFIRWGASVLAILIVIHHEILGFEENEITLFIGPVAPLIGREPDLLLVFVLYAGLMSLEFYAIIFFTHFFIEMMKPRQLRGRSVE